MGRRKRITYCRKRSSTATKTKPPVRKVSRKEIDQNQATLDTYVSNRNVGPPKPSRKVDAVTVPKDGNRSNLLTESLNTRTLIDLTASRLSSHAAEPNSAKESEQSEHRPVFPTFIPITYQKKVMKVKENVLAPTIAKLVLKRRFRRPESEESRPSLNWWNRHETNLSTI